MDFLSARPSGGHQNKNMKPRTPNVQFISPATTRPIPSALPAMTSSNNHTANNTVINNHNQQKPPSSSSRAQSSSSVPATRAAVKSPERNKPQQQHNQQRRGISSPPTSGRNNSNINNNDTSTQFYERLQALSVHGVSSRELKHHVVYPSTRIPPALFLYKQNAAQMSLTTAAGKNTISSGTIVTTSASKGEFTIMDNTSNSKELFESALVHQQDTSTPGGIDVDLQQYQMNRKRWLPAETPVAFDRMEMRYLAQVFDKLITPGEVADACIPNEKAKKLASGQEIVREAPSESILRLSQKMEGLFIGLHEVARLIAPASSELTALATLGVDKARETFHDVLCHIQILKAEAKRENILRKEMEVIADKHKKDLEELTKEVDKLSARMAKHYELKPEYLENRKNAPKIMLPTNQPTIDDLSQKTRREYDSYVPAENKSLQKTFVKSVLNTATPGIKQIVTGKANLGPLGQQKRRKKSDDGNNAPTQKTVKKIIKVKKIVPTTVKRITKKMNAEKGVEEEVEVDVLEDQEVEVDEEIEEVVFSTSSGNNNNDDDDEVDDEMATTAAIQNAVLTSSERACKVPSDVHQYKRRHPPITKDVGCDCSDLYYHGFFNSRDHRHNIATTVGLHHQTTSTKQQQQQSSSGSPIIDVISPDEDNNATNIEPTSPASPLRKPTTPSRSPSSTKLRRAGTSNLSYSYLNRIDTFHHHNNSTSSEGNKNNNNSHDHHQNLLSQILAEEEDRKRESLFNFELPAPRLFAFRGSLFVQPVVRLFQGAGTIAGPTSWILGHEMQQSALGSVSNNSNNTHNSSSAAVVLSKAAIQKMKDEEEKRTRERLAKANFDTIGDLDPKAMELAGDLKWGGSANPVIFKNNNKNDDAMMMKEESSFGSYHHSPPGSPGMGSPQETAFGGMGNPQETSEFYPLASRNNKKTGRGQQQHASFRSPGKKPSGKKIHRSKSSVSPFAQNLSTPPNNHNNGKNNNSNDTKHEESFASSNNNLSPNASVTFQVTSPNSSFKFSPKPPSANTNSNDDNNHSHEDHIGSSSNALKSPTVLSGQGAGTFRRLGNTVVSLIRKRTNQSSTLNSSNAECQTDPPPETASVEVQTTGREKDPFGLKFGSPKSSGTSLRRKTLVNNGTTSSSNLNNNKNKSKQSPEHSSPGTPGKSSSSKNTFGGKTNNGGGGESNEDNINRDADNVLSSFQEELGVSSGNGFMNGKSAEEMLDMTAVVDEKVSMSSDAMTNTDVTLTNKELWKMSFLDCIVAANVRHFDGVMAHRRPDFARVPDDVLEQIENQTYFFELLTPQDQEREMKIAMRRIVKEEQQEEDEREKQEQEQQQQRTENDGNKNNDNNVNKNDKNNNNQKENDEKNNNMMNPDITIETAPPKQIVPQAATLVVRRKRAESQIVCSSSDQQQNSTNNNNNNNTAAVSSPGNVLQDWGAASFVAGGGNGDSFAASFLGSNLNNNNSGGMFARSSTDLLLTSPTANSNNSPTAAVSNRRQQRSMHSNTILYAKQLPPVWRGELGQRPNFSGARIKNREWTASIVVECYRSVDILLVCPSRTFSMNVLEFISNKFGDRTRQARPYLLDLLVNAKIMCLSSMRCFAFIQLSELAGFAGIDDLPEIRTSTFLFYFLFVLQRLQRTLSFKGIGEFTKGYLVLNREALVALLDAHLCHIAASYTHAADYESERRTYYRTLLSLKSLTADELAVIRFQQQLPCVAEGTKCPEPMPVVQEFAQNITNDTDLWGKMEGLNTSVPLHADVVLYLICRNHSSLIQLIVERAKRIHQQLYEKDLMRSVLASNTKAQPFEANVLPPPQMIALQLLPVYTPVAVPVDPKIAEMDNEMMTVDDIKNNKK